MHSSQVKSAMRALEIMELFRAVKQPRSMSEISIALGYPQSSTTVLLKTLISLGYLNFNRKERLYFPTLKVSALGDWIANSLFSSRAILEILQDVHAETGETVAITTKNDIYVQYIQIIQSVHALRFHVNENEIRPLTMSSTGWMLMSTMDDKTLDNTIRRANVITQKEGVRFEINEMMTRIHRIREQGYASAEHLPFIGGGTICVLLPITIQGQPVTMGLGGALDRIKQNYDHYLELLLQGAKQLKSSDRFHEPIELPY
ncbi:helix-turn-helix domain-containing protein [Acinetobacter qingfengensis]|uniref:Transcriptional regulator n=1 Tax=Acinetobacter qingfengensis TaxID=1262585 RepID=A0A1E7RCR8_9GAMM|nr:helix-turn-helix domain-containing protein [Acinetobacter qingfengensis]KAA8735065.1 helix-turn-helix domain-containing protein [Acinetobacter qingfengensis]OEY97017.1 transcriptional regulator [Acinetobacter qingfengensis]